MVIMCRDDQCFDVFDILSVSDIKGELERLDNFVYIRDSGDCGCLRQLPKLI